VEVKLLVFLTSAPEVKSELHASTALPLGETSGAHLIGFVVSPRNGWDIEAN
jgi:hypothetical protein